MVSDKESVQTFRKTPPNRLRWGAPSLFYLKSGIVKIGKEFPYIQKVKILVRKPPINFQNPELPKLVRNSLISKKSKNW